MRTVCRREFLLDPSCSPQVSKHSPVEFDTPVPLYDDHFRKAIVSAIFREELLEQFRSVRRFGVLNTPRIPLNVIPHNESVPLPAERLYHLGTTNIHEPPLELRTYSCARTLLDALAKPLLDGAPPRIPADVPRRRFMAAP